MTERWFTNQDVFVFENIYIPKGTYGFIKGPSEDPSLIIFVTEIGQAHIQVPKSYLSAAGGGTVD